VLLLRHDLPSHGILDLGLTRTLLGSSRQMGWLAFVDGCIGQSIVRLFDTPRILGGNPGIQSGFGIG
jgi:hypothetical protein